MSATLQDLREALGEAADETIAPTGLELLQGVERGLARARRRTLVGGCSVAVAALAVVGIVAVGQGRKDAAVPSGPPTSGSLRVVADDPTFSEFDRGLHRIAVVELPLGSDGSVDLSSVERPDRRIYAWRYCTGTQGDPPVLRLVSGTRVRYLECPTRTASTTGRPSALWFSGEAGRQVVVSASDAEAHGAARIAFYEEATREEYPMPRRPTDLASNPDYAWESLPGTVLIAGPADPAAPNVRRSITVPYQERMGVAVELRGPGRVTLGLNGRGVNLYCGDPGRIAFCVPEQLVGDTLTTWAYGRATAGVYFDNEAGMEVGKPLTITVDPSSFQGDDWRVVVHTREP